MKTRCSFVTNSSSSSFLCKINKTSDEVEEELRRVISLYNDMMDRSITFEDCFGPIYEYTEDYYNEDMQRIKDYSTNGYTWDGYGYEHKDNIGKIMITSCGDNSIPYELQNIIERKFNAYRYHLG